MILLRQKHQSQHLHYLPSSKCLAEVSSLEAKSGKENLSNSCKRTKRRFYLRNFSHRHLHSLCPQIVFSITYGSTRSLVNCLLHLSPGRHHLPLLDSPLFLGHVGAVHHPPVPSGLVAGEAVGLAGAIQSRPCSLN